VGIDGDPWLTKGMAANHIGGLSTDTGKLDELCHR
jgi:hypothetical protein